MGCLEPTEAAWLAGVIDGEGTLSVIRATRRSSQIVYVPVVIVANTHRGFIDRCAELFRKCAAASSTSVAYRPKDGRRVVYRVATSSRKALKPLLIDVLPYLIVKRERAIAVLAWIEAREEGASRRMIGRIGGGTPYGPETDTLMSVINATR